MSFGYLIGGVIPKLGRETLEYKISELVEKTNVPKSTILYYIQEGLLPEAKKIKSNVHRYSDEHIELIKYIKYMKENIGSSNEQIKHELKNKNQSFSSSYAMLEPLMNALSSVSIDTKHYTKNEFISTYKVDEELLETLLKDDILLPINSDDYTEKEASIIHLVESFKNVGIDYEILKSYVFHAKELSELEHQIKIQLCINSNSENFSTLWKILFEILFNAKNYIFSRNTYRMFFSSIRNEISK